MNINVNLNAEAIWQTLDTKDGNRDSKIQKNIWDSFADIVGGNHINESIEERNALKSINSYLKRASEETINKICEFLGWNNSTGNIEENIQTADTLLEQLAQNPEMVTETEEGTYEDGTTWKKATLADGRFVKIDYAANGKIESVKVSTNVESIEHYDGEVYDGSEVNFTDEGLYSGSYDANYLAFDVKSDDYDFSKYETLAEQIFGANIPEDAKYAFSESKSLLEEMAAMNPKPQPFNSKHAGEDCKEAKLPDGRYIRVFYDTKGEIDSIMVSFDTTLDPMADGRELDGAEAYFTADFAQYNIELNGDWDGEVTTGYNFEELKALAEQIFG